MSSRPSIGALALSFLCCLTVPAAEPSGRTDLDGDPLPADAVARLGSIRFRQSSGTGALAFSPDGKLLLTGSRYGHVWNVSTGREVGRLVDPQSDFKTLRCTSDGKYIVSASGLGDIRVWDLDSGKEQRSLVGHRGLIQFLSISSNGNTLYGCGADRLIHIWDLRSGSELHQIQGHNHNITAMDLSSDDKQLLTACQDGMIRLWDPAERKEILRIDVTALGHIEGAIFAPDGKTVFGVSRLKRSLRSWDSKTGKEVQQYQVGSPSNAIAISPDGKSLVTGDEEPSIPPPWRIVRMLDVASGKELRTFDIRGTTEGAFEFSRDGKYLAIGSGSSFIRVVEVATGKLLRGSIGHLGVVNLLEFSPDGKHLFSASEDQSLRVWDAETGKESASYAEVAFAVPTLAVRKSDNKLVCTSGGRKIVTAEIAALIRADPAALRIKEAQLPAGQIITIAGCSNGKLIAVEVGDGKTTTRFIDCQTGKEIQSLQVESSDAKVKNVTMWLIALAPDARRLAGRCSDRTFRIWDVDQKTEIRRLPLLVQPGILEFSPDGRSLLIDDAKIHLWEVCSGRERWRFDFIPIGGVTSLAFSPDGQLVAIGSGAGKISLRVFGTGKELKILDTGQGPVRALRFAPDGQRLASGGQDTTILVWDVAADVRAARRPEVRLESRELMELWQDLGQNDAGAALVAVDRLAACTQAPEFIRDNLKPTVRLDAGTIDRLIRELNADDDAVRDRATAALEDAVDQAEPALRKVLAAGASIEVRTRVERILDKGKGGRAPTAMLRTVRAVEVLELAGTKPAREVLEGMAKNDKSSLLAGEAKLALERMTK